MVLLEYSSGQTICRCRDLCEHFCDIESGHVLIEDSQCQNLVVEGQLYAFGRLELMFNGPMRQGDSGY